MINIIFKYVVGSFVLLAIVFSLIRFVPQIIRHFRNQGVTAEDVKERIKGRKKIIISVSFIIILLVFLSSCFYSVDQTEYAFIVTLGKPNSDIIEPGLRFKLPFIQSVKKLSKETYSLTFGYTEDVTAKKKDKKDSFDTSVTVIENEAKMITGDENIIMVDFEIQWRIIDPIKFVYSNEDPVLTLRNAISTSLKGVIGRTSVDDVLTDGRSQIMNDVRALLTELIASYDIGINIVNVNLQDVDLPTAEVDQAFKRVTSAREERMTKINEATKYKNEKVNAAKGTESALISNAERMRTERIEKAKGDVATFNAIYTEYAKNKSVTKQRLVIETLNQIMPGMKIYIMDEGTGTVKYLPIEAIGSREGGKN